MVWLLLEGGCRNLEGSRAFVWFFLGKRRKRKLEEREKGVIPMVFLGGSLERRLQSSEAGSERFFRGNGERFWMLV